MTHLSSWNILFLVTAYFAVLMAIAWFTGRKTENFHFFLADKKAPWGMVAFGMIGASISGVTFLSIPGVVGNGGNNQAFSYMQMVFGYLLGYLAIGTILLPLYYRHNLVSIYRYLKERLGPSSYRCGSVAFLLSRSTGSALRMYIVTMVFQQFVLEPLGVPFWLTVSCSIGLIWLYTYRGGIATIVWTDTFQTFCMLLALVVLLLGFASGMGLSYGEVPGFIASHSLSKTFFLDVSWNDPNHFAKQFLSGALIALTMTGLDQDLMQKNLSCRTLGESQKNMGVFCIILVLVNILFLSLGVMLYAYLAHNQLERPEGTDQVLAQTVLNHLPVMSVMIFFIGLTASNYASADSALTALTTSVCYDFLRFEEKKASGVSEKRLQQQRLLAHIGVSVTLLLLILLFRALHNEAVINTVFKVAGYTYGPLLGLFGFGLLTKRSVQDSWAPWICLLAPLLCFLFEKFSPAFLNGFQLGNLVIALNGLLVFLGFYLSSLAAEKFSRQQIRA